MFPRLGAGMAVTTTKNLAAAKMARFGMAANNFGRTVGRPRKVSPSPWPGRFVRTGCWGESEFAILAGNGAGSKKGTKWVSVAVPALRKVFWAPCPPHWVAWAVLKEHPCAGAEAAPGPATTSTRISTTASRGDMRALKRQGPPRPKPAAWRRRRRRRFWHTAGTPRRLRPQPGKKR